MRGKKILHKRDQEDIPLIGGGGWSRRENNPKNEFFAKNLEMKSLYKIKNKISVS
jgi:hypothetical protein